MTAAFKHDTPHTPHASGATMSASDLTARRPRDASFLGIEIDEDKWPAILKHCSFDYMKKNADLLSDVAKEFFDGGLTNFIYKGPNGRWRDVLNREDIERYERAANENLTADCAHWLANGELPQEERIDGRASR
jgi:aryl sulfotransferase